MLHPIVAWIRQLLPADPANKSKTKLWHQDLQRLEVMQLQRILDWLSVRLEAAADWDKMWTQPADLNKVMSLCPLKPCP